MQQILDLNPIMARPLRIEFPGELFHVTACGGRRESTFLNDTGHQQWLQLLEQVCERFNGHCHAYCLMDHHYHIVVETIDGNLSAGMCQLNGIYAVFPDRRHMPLRVRLWIDYLNHQYGQSNFWTRGR